MKKRLWTRIITCVLLVATLLSIAIIPASAAPEYPDGGTYTTYDHLGSERKATFYFRRRSDEKLLKTFVMYGPKGEYYVDGLQMWGYTPYEEDFPWHLMVDAEITSMASNTTYDGMAFYTQIGVSFTLLLSPSTYEGTVWLDPDPCAVTTRHILVDQNGNETLHSSSTTTFTYDNYYAVNSKTITGYNLASGFKSQFAGNFNWDIVGASPNIPEDNYSARFHSVTWSNEGNDRCYFDERKLNIDFKYTLKTNPITYDANGGTGAPAAQTKYYNVDTTLSTQVPTREGYTFAGWGTYAGDTSANYQPGATYTSNGALSLYAVWQQNGYTIKYDANGGTGAPASQTKLHDTVLTLRSTKPTRTGYTFKGWATTNGEIQAVKYAAGGQYWLNEPATLYAVWQKNPAQYTVSYNANGGSGAPASQTKTENVALTLSSTKPTRSGYTFLGWSTSSTATTPSYYPGSSYTTNASTTLYAVWEKLPETYTIKYNANGGTGAPATQTKTEDISITLSSTKPTREGYKFLGWSTSSTASSATYQPGATYSNNASITLYAVWRKDNYDISVSNLKVGSTSVEQYSDTTVSVRVDNWCQNKAYNNIPVELLYNGTVVATKNINLSIYGVATVNFSLNVGKPLGNNTITARVNWADRANETDPNDNSVSTTVEVTPYEYDLYISHVTPNAQYREGTDVVTSFMIYNDREQDILPEHNNAVFFRAHYYDESGNMKVIAKKTWNQTVIPSKNSNLVYFRWSVPEGLAGKTIYITGIVNSSGSVNESDTSNNTTEFTMKILGKLDSQPTNTNYSDAPDWYDSSGAPAVSYGTATWNQWVYENGGLVLKKYGLGISTIKPTLAPSDSVSTAVQNGNSWTIKSGYGIQLEYEPYLRSLSGYLVPTGTAFTGIQTVYAMFPEFEYSNADGYIAVLSKDGSTYEFVPSEYSNTGEPVHFIPVWMENGQYVVAVYAGEVWTPAGMIYTIVNSSNMSINGTLYDDYYVGE